MVKDTWVEERLTTVKIRSGGSRDKKEALILCRAIKCKEDKDCLRCPQRSPAHDSTAIDCDSRRQGR